MSKKPYFRAFDGWWYVQLRVGGKRKQVKLVKGKENWRPARAMAPSRSVAAVTAGPAATATAGACRPTAADRSPSPGRPAAEDRPADVREVELPWRDAEEGLQELLVVFAGRRAAPRAALVPKRGRDAALSQQMAVQALEDLRQQQASSLAYFDVFWVCGALGVALVFLVPLMKRSVAEKGAPVGAE
jgi:hypothetical protein